MEREILFNKIEKAFKQGCANICPKCNNITEVHSNPFYYWECETCGHKGDYMNLEMKTTKDFVMEIIDEYCKNGKHS